MGQLKARVSGAWVPIAGGDLATINSRLITLEATDARTNQQMAASGSGTVLGSGSPGGQIPGLQVTIPTRPYPRSVIAVCQVGLTWVSGGANAYWIVNWVWTGLWSGSNSPIYLARADVTGTMQGTSLVQIAANTVASVTMHLSADVAASAAISGTYLHLLLIPAGPLS